MGWLDSLIGGVIDYNISKANQNAQAEENVKARDFASSQQEDAQAFNSEEAQKARDFASSQQEDAQAFNSEEAALNRDWQSHEAALNRDFQAQQAEEAYQRQVDFYEQYQSIGAQVRQYKEAGLNPALLAGGVSVGSTPSSSGGNGSMPSGSAASSSALGGSSASSSALGASASALPEVIGMAKEVFDLQAMKQSIENMKKQGEKISAETENIKETTNLTAQQVLTERERTSEVKALASEIGNRDRIQVERWNKESVKISEEIDAIKASKELDVAKKEEAIAMKLYNESRAAYEHWKTDTASLRYWTSTGAYALSASLRNLADIGLSVARITDLFKGKMQKGLKLPSNEVNVPDGTGYTPPRRNTRADDFIEEMSAIFEGLDLE